LQKCNLFAGKFLNFVERASRTGFEYRVLGLEHFCQSRKTG
jgi:hypothetical protein